MLHKNLWYLLVCVYIHLHGCLTSSMHDDSHVKAFYMLQAQENLRRIVVLSPDELVIDPQEILPKDYHIHVLNLAETQQQSVSDFLKSYEKRNRATYALEIAVYYHKRARQKEHAQCVKEFNIDMSKVTWQQDNSEKICAYMLELLGRQK